MTKSWYFAGIRYLLLVFFVASDLSSSPSTPSIRRPGHFHVRLFKYCNCTCQIIFAQCSHSP